MTNAFQDGRQGQTGTQAIERALAVLGCFMGPRPELGVTETANLLGLNPSTTHRIMRTLAAAGYLAQNPETERYHLGRTAVLLGAVAQHAAGLELVAPILEHVAETTGESVNFVVLDRDAGIIMHRIESRHPLRFAQPIGTRVGFHCSASGKALLAFHPDGEDAIRRLGRLVRHNEHTLTTRAALARELALIRERGYSLDEQETQLGVRCIAAPILDANGVAHGAIAVQIPTVRMPQSKLPELAPLVKQAAEQVGALTAAAHLISAR